MNLAYIRVSCKRQIMLLQRPSPARYAATWVVAWCILALCLALDFYGSWTLANSPAIGAELRSEGSAVVVASLQANGALRRAGVHVGDHVLSIAGRQVAAAAFLSDPDNSASWRDYDLLWDWQQFLTTAAERKSLTIVLDNGPGSRTVELPVHPLGWRKAIARSWALRLVGWSFALLPLLIWIKKQNETSLINLITSCGVFIVFSTMSAYIYCDLCLAPRALTLLKAFNTLGALSVFLTPHLALVFPTPVSWLKRFPWLRVLPWSAYAIVLALHFLRVFPSPAPTVYLLSVLAMTVFFAIFVVRLLRSTNPLARAQLLWVTLGALAGFLPWVLLSAIPEAVHLTPIPERFTLLSAVTVPLCVYFAIVRYRLLDVDRIFDWVVAHAVALGGFSLLELAFWNWLSIHYAPQAVAKPLLLAISLSLMMFFYAPLRSWALHGMRKLSGTVRPSLAESLHKLLERAQATEDPSAALEQTLQWMLNPARLSWVLPGQNQDALLKLLEFAPDGLLGYALGEECPRSMESAAWVPVQIGQTMAAVVLFPRGSRGWSRHDLRIARALARAGEPLFEMRHMKSSLLQTQADLREQREELVREMHDGLGSQLFGASLLSNVSEKLTEPELRKRFADVSAALSDAMDSLRTGLTVLGAPPGAFSPALLALLMRAERVFEAAGIALQTQIDDETVSLQLDSRSVFSILRAMQEALTNIARHSKASKALVRLALRGNTMAILIQDDGVGFLRNPSRGGHGLANITRRLQMLGGSAAINAAPSNGCTIVLSLPVRIGAL
jgi:signal transduction histidine kinase